MAAAGGAVEQAGGGGDEGGDAGDDAGLAVGCQGRRALGSAGQRDQAAECPGGGFGGGEIGVGAVVAEPGDGGGGQAGMLGS